MTRSMTQAYGFVAGVLLGLLGIARGVGGVVVLARGVAVESDARAAAPAALIGGGLIVVAVICLVACVLALRGHRAAFSVGAAGLTLFVAGGLVNGTLLYGSPRAIGAIGNLAYAALVLVMLLLARRTGATPPPSGAGVA